VVEQTKQDHPFGSIETLGHTPDEQIDLAAAALAIAAINHPGISLERFHHHLNVLVSEVGARHAALLKGGAKDDAGARLAALKHTLSDGHGYAGDVEGYNDLQNASLIRVIDRAQGLPITLSILYIHAARGQGWSVSGLNLPGHFVCRLEKDGERLIFDPFNACALLGAAELRQLVKKALGPNAELSTQYYEAATNREILIRLQNNIKYRQIEVEDYAGALVTVELMRKIDPAEYRLLLDAGVLYARLDQPVTAIEMLSEYIKSAPNHRDRQEAELLLLQLKDTLE
jgi:regulator of sirC expression with transglutaminase-like and TPR domain